MQTLIVEDDDLMADLMETVVAGLQPGMRVVKAATLSEAVQRWQQDAPNLLVIDWNLPDGDGLQLVRAVRARDPDVPIVMITGRADRQSILTAAHYHINGYITKPFKVEMLHSRLQALVATLAEPAVGDEDAGEALDTVLAEELESVIQMPARTDAAAILALMSRTGRAVRRPAGRALAEGRGPVHPVAGGGQQLFVPAHRQAGGRCPGRHFPAGGWHGPELRPGHGAGCRRPVPGRSPAGAGPRLPRPVRTGSGGGTADRPGAGQAPGVGLLHRGACSAGSASWRCSRSWTSTYARGTR